MSSDSPKPAFKSIEVNIFNQVYSLRTNRDAEQMKRIAQLVDERMRLLSAHATTHDLAKLAIFAALNIADELNDTREYYERELQSLLARSIEQEKLEEERAKEREQPQPEEPETVEAKPDEAQSWFEAIFDSSETTRNRGERLSSKVSAKLQSLRQPPPETPLTIEEDN